LGSKPVDFPVEENYKLKLVEGSMSNDPRRYHRLMGRLIYLTITRPELSDAIHVLS